MEVEIGATHTDLSLVESWFSSDKSSGYLEDAITGWGIWCNKQNNLPSHSQEDQKKNNYLGYQEDLSPTFPSTASQILHASTNFNTSRNISSSSSSPQKKDTHVAEVKHVDSSQRSSASRESDENDASVSRGGNWKRIAYPFELVKPGGVEGETTLKDINHQMLMTPSKPIPHPVGQSSLPYSCISSNRGYGISGKEVAALVRIHTQGRGSITIIRTKG